MFVSAHILVGSASIMVWAMCLYNIFILCSLRPVPVRRARIRALCIHAADMWTKTKRWTIGVGEAQTTNMDSTLNTRHTTHRQQSADTMSMEKTKKKKRLVKLLIEFNQIIHDEWIDRVKETATKCTIGEALNTRRRKIANTLISSTTDHE